MELDVTSLTGRRADHRWDRVCAADIVERLTWSGPDRVILVGWQGAYADERFAELTASDLDALVNQVANGLIAKGLQPGDRATMVCENSVEAYAFKLGCAKAGVVAAPLNPAMASDMTSYLLDQHQPRFVLIDGALVEKMAEPLAGAGVSIDVTIEIGGPLAPGSTSFSAFVDEQPKTEPEVRIHGDDIWEILSTSGTTAMPKGVMLSHTSATLAAHGFALSLTRGVRFETDVVLAAFLPMIYHIGHQIFALATWAAGGRLVLGRSPQPEEVARCVEEQKVTTLWAGSPAMVAAFARAVDADDRDISALQVAVFGWAALPPEVLDQLRERAPDVQPVEIFGQTESIACHRYWVDERPELYRATSPRDNYVGLPSPLVASTVVDPAGNDLRGRPGIPGEAVYRSPVMVAGYYRDEEATRTAFRGGWFHSGDTCAYDENGLRVMLDRSKDIVKTGGENVSSLRVEAVMVRHPGVEKVAVIGLPDERWGEAVTAVVVPAAERPDPDELIAFAREQLAGFETPKRVIFADALPETVGGKVMKYRLRREFGAGGAQPAS